MAFQDEFQVWLESEDRQPPVFLLIFQKNKPTAKEVADALVDSLLGSTVNLCQVSGDKIAINEVHYQSIKLFFQCIILLEKEASGPDIYNAISAKIAETKEKVQLNSGIGVTDVLFSINNLLNQINSEVDVSPLTRSSSEGSRSKTKPEQKIKKQSSFGSIGTFFRRNSGKIEAESAPSKTNQDWRKIVKETLSPLVKTHDHAFWVAARMILNGDVFETAFNIYAEDLTDKTSIQQRNMALIFGGQPINYDPIDLKHHRYGANPLPLVEARILLYNLTGDKKYLDRAKAGWKNVGDYCNKFYAENAEYNQYVKQLVDNPRYLEELLRRKEARESHAKLLLELENTKLNFGDKAPNLNEYAAPEENPDYQSVSEDYIEEGKQSVTRLPIHEYAAVSDEGDEKYIEVAAEKKEDNEDDENSENRSCTNA